MRLRRRALVLGCLGIAGLLAAGALAPRHREVVFVPPGASVRQALASAPAGATVRLGPGVHQGPLTLAQEVELEGSGGTIVRAAADADAAIAIRADDVSLRDLTVSGGVTGILVEHSQDVAIEDVTVSGAELHGIHIAASRARVTAATVNGLRSPYAQGIELFDAPKSTVQDSRLSGGQEGIASFLSHDVRFEANMVTDTTMRAIAVNEMSDGRVEGNLIDRAEGAGLFCGDMSRCAFSDNRVVEVSPGRGKSGAGWGLVVEYHAVASTDDDRLAGTAGPSATFFGSRFVDSSPLELGRGWKAIFPAGVATVAALTFMALVAALVARLLSRLAGKRPDARAPRLLSMAAIATLSGGLAVQTFHIAEHFLQVFRVHADGVPSRGGIIGSVVEPEWVHFTYNLAVLLMFALVAIARMRGWKPAGNLAAGDSLLAAGLLVQGYHVLEHTVKVAQHIASGAKVNPGLLGAHIDLVWLHFAINIAVYAAFVGTCVCYMWVRRWSFRKVAHAVEI